MFFGLQVNKYFLFFLCLLLSARKFSSNGGAFCALQSAKLARIAALSCRRTFAFTCSLQTSSAEQRTASRELAPQTRHANSVWVARAIYLTLAQFTCRCNNTQSDANLSAASAFKFQSDANCSQQSKRAKGFFLAVLLCRQTCAALFCFVCVLAANFSFDSNSAELILKAAKNQSSTSSVAVQFCSLRFVCRCFALGAKRELHSRRFSLRVALKSDAKLAFTIFEENWIFYCEKSILQFSKLEQQKAKQVLYLRPFYVTNWSNEWRQKSSDWSANFFISRSFPE